MQNKIQTTYPVSFVYQSRRRLMPHIQQIWYQELDLIKI